MSKRVGIVKKIDKLLEKVLEVGNELLLLTDEIEDKELKTKVLMCSILLSTGVKDINTFLIKNLESYMHKDIDEVEFLRMMKQIKDKRDADKG